MNRTSIPPKKIKNKTYENQNLLAISPVIKQICNVWINSINPIAKGWFIWIKINLEISVEEYKKSCIISGGSLFKILILGINDKVISFLLKF